MAEDTKTAAAKVKKPLTSAERLQKLQERKAALERQIKAAAKQQSGKDRKEDARAKIIFAGSILADMKIHPEGREKVLERVHRGVTKDADRELLQRRGLWN